MRIIRLAIAALVLAAAPASAEEAAPEPVKVVTLSVADPDSGGSLFGFGCTNLSSNVEVLTRVAPADAVRGHDAQVTILRVKVGPNGRTQEVTTLQNSRDRSLDQKAAACARSMTFAAPQRNGSAMPSERTWLIYWIATADSARSENYPIPQMTPPITAGAPQTCGPEFFPEGGGDGAVTVNFIVGADGNVSAPAVEHGSGNAALDAATLSCVQSWRFVPANLDGSRVGMNWSVSVKWEAATKSATSSTGPRAMQASALSHCTMLGPIDAKGALTLKISTEGLVTELVPGAENHLGDKVMQCLKAMRYVGATKNGAPTVADVGLRMNLPVAAK